MACRAVRFSFGVPPAHCPNMRTVKPRRHVQVEATRLTFALVAFKNGVPEKVAELPVAVGEVRGRRADVALASDAQHN